MAGRVYIDACFGFMETPDVPELLTRLDEDHGLGIEPRTATYVLIHETFEPGNDRGMPRWAKWLFRKLSRRAARVSQMFRIPEDQVLVVEPILQL